MLTDLYTPNCLRTQSGVFVNILNPDLETIIPLDISVGLARQCRFGGHTQKFYSVADHSVWCLKYYEQQNTSNTDMALKILLHDAHEYLLGDIPTPLKRLMPEYEAIASNLQDEINYRFGIKVTEEDIAIIKEIDKVALEWEWQNKCLSDNSQYAFDQDYSIFNFHINLKRLCKVPNLL